MTWTWNWERVVEYYEQLGTRTDKALLASAMLQLIIQLRSDPDFENLQPRMLHDWLILYVNEVPKNLPSYLLSGFVPALSFYWTEPNHFRMSLGVHEALIVPADKTLEAAKYQLERIRDLLPALSLTDNEMEKWKEAYSRSGRESILFRFSRMPREWIQTYLDHDLGSYIIGIRKADSQLRDVIKKETISIDEVDQLLKRIECLDVYLEDVLDVAVEVEERFRSEEFLRKMSETE